MFCYFVATTLSLVHWNVFEAGISELQLCAEARPCHDVPIVFNMDIGRNLTNSPARTSAQHRQPRVGHLIRADGVAEPGGVEGDSPASLEVPSAGRVPSPSGLLLLYSFQNTRSWYCHSQLHRRCRLFTVGWRLRLLWLGLGSRMLGQMKYHEA